MSNAIFTYKYVENYVVLGFPEIGYRPTKEFPEHHWLPGIALNCSYRKSLGKQWGGFATMHVGWQFISSEEVPFRGWVSIGRPLTTYLTMVRVDRYNRGGGALPFVRLGFGLERAFENFNRIGVELFGLYSFRRDTFQSDYLLYPGTVDESNGSIQGGVSHAGVRASYTLTYGAPKKPGYLRRAERGAME